ncbi:MAG: hypothetical protein SVR94_18200, partial [Pseudomonadota bacterium]|nr:hypothetical protein [Pseudomonadota bacterium]
DELDKLRASIQSKTVEDLKNEIKDLKDELSKLCENLQQKNKEFERLVNNLSSRLNEKEQQELKELFNNYLEFTHKFCEDLSEAEQFEKGKKERIELFKSLGQT